MAKKIVLKENLKGVDFTTPKFRMSYPSLFEQAKYQGEEVGYKLDALIPKETDLTEFKKAIKAAKVEAFGKDEKNWPKVVSCLKDGDDKGDQENYAGNFYVILKSKKRKPLLVDKKKNEVLDQSEVYGGRWARAAIKIMIVKSGDTFYVACYMNAVQLLDNAPRFGGGGVDLDSAFDEVEDTESEDTSNFEDSDDDSDDIYA